MRYFLNGTTLAGLEREMMRMPGYRPRGGGEMILCRFRYKPEDVDCRNCLAYQRRRCWEVTCPYLLERLEAGTATLPELLSKMFGSWDRSELKHRAAKVIHQTEQYFFAGQLHIARLLRTLGTDTSPVNRRWLAAVYLLSASDVLWQQTLSAVSRDRIDFGAVRLERVGVKEYTLYRAARGICQGKLGVTAEELADNTLVPDDTLLLIISAALVARFGPEVMRIGRAEK